MILRFLGAKAMMLLTTVYFYKKCIPVVNIFAIAFEKLHDIYRT